YKASKMGDSAEKVHEEKVEVEKEHIEKEEKHEKVLEEKKEKHEKVEEKKEKHEEGEDKKKKDKKEKKKKNPEDNKDGAKLKQKLEKIETKIQALVAKKEEILKLIKEADQVAPSTTNVLYKDFSHQPKTNETNYQGCDWSFDLSCKIQDIIPGLSALVGLVIPHSGKVELQYMQDYFGVTGGIGLKTEPIGVFSPILNFSGVVGTSLFSFGTGFSFDLGTREFDKFDTGLSFTNDLLISSLTLDKLDTLKASCYYTVNPLTKTAIAAELKHSFSTSDTSFSVGAQHALMPLTVLKAKVDTHGKVAAMIQQGLWDKLFLSIGGKIDFMDQRRIPNIGLSMAIKV
ncbi:hypothetical protein G4B88_027992, partial [Cannabis sativa]